MDKRGYVQTARAAASDETKLRILAAARATLQRGPLGALKVEEVARDAGVSRSTVYLLYGSRAGLIDSLAREVAQDSGFDRLVTAFALPDAREALISAQRASIEMYAKMPDVSRALYALRTVDPDAVKAVDRLDSGRRWGQADLARRLSEQGYLHDGVSVEEATDILIVLSSFATFDELFGGSGLPVDVVADRIAAMTERSVLRPTSASATGRRRPAPPRPAAARSRA